MKVRIEAMSQRRGRSRNSAVHAIHGDRHFGEVVEEVVDQDLNRQHRQKWQDQRSRRHAEHVAEVGAGAHHHVLHDVAERAAALEHAAVEHAQVLVEQDEVGGFARHVHGAVHREPDVGGVQRRRVVDAVAQVADHVPAAAERVNDAVLLGRRDAAEQAHGLGARRQRRIGQRLDLGSRQHAAHRQAQLGADVLRDQLVDRRSRP